MNRLLPFWLAIPVVLAIFLASALRWVPAVWPWPNDGLLDSVAYVPSLLWLMATAVALVAAVGQRFWLRIMAAVTLMLHLASFATYEVEMGAILSDLPENEISVISWNVRHGAQASPADQVAWLMQLNPDVLALQEVSPSDSTLAELKRRFETVLTDDEGRILASRFPARQAGILSLNPYRGGVFAELATPIGTILAASVHLTSPRLNTMPMAPRRHRSESESLRTFAAEADAPLVLMGDFNAPPQSWLIQSLKRAGLTSAADQRGLGWVTTWHARLGLAQIDYVWLKALTATGFKVHCTTLSDHCALQARMTNEAIE